MKTLYFLRHAKAEPGSKVLGDKERPLAPRGLEACETVGAYLKAKGYRPDFALVSSSVRTKQTFAEVTKTAGMGLRHRVEDALYLATAEEILRVLREAEETSGSLMIVGHNPGMHHIALLLAGTEPTPPRKVLELKYPTCALAVLHFKAKSWKDVAPGKGEIADFITPGEL